MNRIFLLSALFLAGCATQAPRMPVDVALIPDDCANQARIIRWLDEVAATPRAPLQSREEHDNAISSIKHRIWSIRYNCQRVR